MPVDKDELRYETLLKLFFGNECDREITIQHINAFEEKIKKDMPFLQMSVEMLKNDTSEETHKYYMLTALFGLKTYETYLDWCEVAKSVLMEGGNNHE